MSIIGQQIKKYRIENGFTQEQVGKIIGVTTQAVSKWERQYARRRNTALDCRRSRRQR